jgi:hypothetical protein
MNTYKKTGGGGHTLQTVGPDPRKDSRNLARAWVYSLSLRKPNALRLCFHLCALRDVACPDLVGVANSSSFSELTLELDSNAYPNRRF